MSITVSHLTKRYDGQVAVNDISFTVKKGEIVGFLGPNGAGKSTTMKMLTGYLPADSGEMMIDDVDVNKYPMKAKRMVGYLPESNALYYDMYVREYLDFIGSLHQLQNKKAAIETVIEQVGLTAERKKQVGQLSKGYKQRVGLAAALLHQPEVLILDEPTSGLDPNQIIEIREVIRQQGKDRLVLFSSHILQEVEAICDRVLIINKGKIVADDSLQNLQKQSAANVVKVSFNSLPDKTILQTLDPVISINEAGEATWNIETNEPEKIRRQLQRLATDNNLDIVSLQSESASLEDVFKTLTMDRS